MKDVKRWNSSKKKFSDVGQMFRKYFSDVGQMLQPQIQAAEANIK